MQLKTNVNIQGLDIRMRPALIAASEIWKSYGQELVITSGLDSMHSAGSLHYYGLALDFRTRYFNGATKMAAANSLRKELAKYFYFNVVLHKTHIHVEYDSQ